MTEFDDRTSDAYLVGHNYGATDHNEHNEMDDCSDSGDSSPKSESSTSSSSSSSSGSWSIDDSIEFMQTSHKPLFDELPTFSFRSDSPNGRSLSPLVNEPISLFNLSISPISSVEDLSHISDQQNYSSSNFSLNGKFSKDLTHSSDSIGSVYDDDERISMEEITAQINTPPILSRSNKRLNLETIFEDVLLETPKKRRFNGFKQFNSWRIETYQKITNEERISSYVIEQQQNHDIHDTPPDTTNNLCTAFDAHVKLNP